MTVVKCLKCGKEYILEKDDNPLNFQCECGGDLKHKDYPLKSLQTIKFLKITSLSILSLILVLFAIFTFYTYAYHMENQSTVTNNTTIAYSTYTAHGITFQYPAEMIKIKNLNNSNRWGFTDPVVAFYEPEDNKTEYDNIDTYFYIKQRSVTSLAEQLSSYRRDIKEIGQTEVSERNITINGMKAVELIKTWHAGGKQYKALTVHIEAVPGSLYYRIGCVTPADEFESNLSKFEMIVQSFNVV